MHLSKCRETFRTLQRTRQEGLLKYNSFFKPGQAACRSENKAKVYCDPISSCYCNCLGGDRKYPIQIVRFFLRLDVGNLRRQGHPKLTQRSKNRRCSRRIVKKKGFYGQILRVYPCAIHMSLEKHLERQLSAKQSRIFVAKRNIPEKVYLSVNNLLIRVPNPLIFE